MIGKEANHPAPRGCLFALAREPTTLPTRFKSLSRHKPPSTPTAKRQNKKPKPNIMFDLSFSWRAKKIRTLRVGVLYFFATVRGDELSFATRNGEFAYRRHRAYHEEQINRGICVARRCSFLFVLCGTINTILTPSSIPLFQAFKYD